MFSQTDGLQKLDQISKQLAVKARESGGGEVWVPEYHSIAYIESFESHFKELGRKAEEAGIDLESMLGYEELKPYRQRVSDLLRRLPLLV